MWPKRNFEQGYSSSQSNRFRGIGGVGGFPRRGGASSYNIGHPAAKSTWSTRPAARKSYGTSWNRPKAKSQGAPKFVAAKKVGAKRQLDKTDKSQGPSSQSKKRQKSNEQKLNEKKPMDANNAQLPLTTVILAKPGDNSGSLPDLVFNGFYDCTQEAKLGKKKHFLRLNVTRKLAKSKKPPQEEEGYKPNDRVSIPVPLASIEAVAVISGMNPFENLMKAHASTISLQASMEHWGRVIDRRREAMEKKKKELDDISDIEDEVEEDEESEPSAVDLESSSEEEVAEIEDEEVEEADSEAEDKPIRRSKRQKLSSAKAKAEKAKKAKEAAERKKQAKQKRAEEKKLAKEKKIAERLERTKMLAEMKKKRAAKLKKRNLIMTSVDKLVAAVEKAKQGLENEKKKMQKIIKTYGDELAYFQTETDQAEALAHFESELKEGLNFSLEDDSEDEPDEEMNDPGDKDKEMEGAETTDLQADENMKSEPEEEGPRYCSTCGAKQSEKKKFCGDCGAKQEEVPLGKIPKKKGKAVVAIVPKPSDDPISDIPVWIAISLKKPLEKFYASDANTTICDRDVVEKAELILMKFHPKHRSRIVLKNVTYEGAEEHLKLLNEVFEGPWKSLRVSKEKFFTEKTRYSLEKTLHYLAKRYTRQKIADTTIEKCKLCGKELRHMVMEKHLKEFCPMREEPCKYCGAVIVVSKLEEHEKVCPKYPVRCPQGCGKTLLRCQIEEHLKICENSIVECEFKHVGCNTQFKRKDITRHLKNNALEHVKFLNKRVQLMSTYFSSIDPALNKLLHPTPPPKEAAENEEEVKDINENALQENQTVEGEAEANGTLC